MHDVYHDYLITAHVNLNFIATIIFAFIHIRKGTNDKIVKTVLAIDIFV